MSEIATAVMEKSFAVRIKAARKKLGLSQEQAAKDWGFSVGTLEAWEQEYRNPAGLYRDKLEEVLKQIEQGSQSDTE
jgi:DNA-binding transcriptional regulator YiaG